MLCFSIVSKLRRPAKSASKNGSCRGLAAEAAAVDKICTPPARENALDVKIVKNWRLLRLLEIELRKICTTPARESDWEIKIVKNWQARSTFGSSASQNLHHACAAERFASQNR